MIAAIENTQFPVGNTVSLFVMQFNIFYETLYEIQFEKSNTFHICNAISKMLM